MSIAYFEDDSEMSVESLRAVVSRLLVSLVTNRMKFINLEPISSLRRRLNEICVPKTTLRPLLIERKDKI